MSGGGPGQWPGGLVVEQGAISEWEQGRLLVAVLQALDGVKMDGRRERSRVKRYGLDYQGTGLWKGPAPLELYTGGVDPDEFDSVTVNEYQAGHGIDAHIDCDRFGEPIVTVSLGAAATMFFMDGRRVERVRLEPGAKVTMAGESRWRWLHGMEDDNRAVRWSVVYRRWRRDRDLTAVAAAE